MNIFEEYYQTQKAIEILQQELDDKKAAIVEKLQSSNYDKVSIPGATFYLKKDYSYAFSEETQIVEQTSGEVIDKLKENIKGHEKAIKHMKAEEIENGKAELVDTKVTMVMRQVKGGE